MNAYIMEDIKWMSDPEIQKGIGLKIKEWRLSANRTQKDTAEKAGVSLITLQKIEKGQGVQLSSLIYVLRALNRLDILSPFFEERRPSPIELQRIEEGRNIRRRASKSQDHDKNAESTPVW